jgi:hypothetical protein
MSKRVPNAFRARALSILTSLAVYRKDRRP